MQPSSDRPWHVHYPNGVASVLEIERATLPELLLRAVERSPDAPALSFLGARFTYAELLDEVRRFATVLAGLGVGRDSRVAIQLPNLPQTVIAFQATLLLGAQAVMTNPLYTAREIEHQWTDAGCEVAVTTDYLYAKTLRACRDRLPIREWVLASIPEYLPWPIRWLAPLKLKKKETEPKGKVAGAGAEK